MMFRLHKPLFIFCIFGSILLLPGFLKAQGFYFYDNGYYEPSWVLDLSLNIGIANPVMDIGGSKKDQSGLNPYNLRTPKLAGGFSLTASHNDWLAFRLDLAFGRVEAHDSLLKDATHFSSIGRFERNLNFRASTFEAFLAAEFHPLFLRDYQVNDRYPPRISPYIIAGIGLINWKTRVFYGNEMIDVKPLRLEGQGFAEYPDRPVYRNVALTFPVGLGIKYDVSRVITLRGELIHKFTNTDHIDDVSWGDWVNPELFSNYLSPDQAALASQLYNRSTIINPPRNTRPRGDETNKDIIWNVQLRVGFALNRGDRNRAFKYNRRSGTYRAR
jgi:hypothetical protein